jgi:hypothetical protein
MTAHAYKLSPGAGAAAIATFLVAREVMRHHALAVADYVLLAGLVPFVGSQVFSQNAKLRWFLIGATVGVELAAAVFMAAGSRGH